MQLEGRLRDGL